MAKRLKTIKRKKTTDRAETRTEEAAPATATVNDTSSGEKIRTSLFLDHSLIARVKERCRLIGGLSFNAYVTIALVERLGRDMHPASPPPIHLHMDSLLLGRAAAPTPPAPPVLAPFQKKWGDGFTFKADMPDEEDGFATWDQVAQYAARAAKRPDDNWMKIGRALGFEENVARAADFAVMSGAWDEYQEARRHG